MYHSKKIVGIIPARKNSKSILNKNMAFVCGKPLLFYTIQSALKSVFLDEIVVSTDGEQIASYSLNEGVSVINRPAELAQDTSKTIDCVIHALDELKKQGKEFDYMLLLQPTSPLRRTEHIDGMISWMIDAGYENAVSVTHIPYNPILMRNKSADALDKMINTSSTVRRQDMKKTYYVDGCLYLYKTQGLTLETSLNDAAHGFEIDGFSSVDVNVPDDLQKCEFLLSMQQEE